MCLPSAGRFRSLLKDPQALGVWTTEIGQKTGILPIPHQEHTILGLAFPVLALPWPVLALGWPLRTLRRLPPGQAAVEGLRSLVPMVVGSRKPGRCSVCWAVAKPNYYVPCLPGLALLVGMTWIRLSHAGRGLSGSVQAVRARFLLRLQVLLLILSGMVVPLLGRSYLTAGNSPWLLVIGGAITGSAVVGAWIWLRGSAVLALLPVTMACAMAVVIGYGIVAPADNLARGHRELARTIERLVPRETTKIRFFHEIDEGLLVLPPSSSSGSRAGKSAPVQRQLRQGWRFAGDRASPCSLSGRIPPADRSPEASAQGLASSPGE